MSLKTLTAALFFVITTPLFAQKTKTDSTAKTAWLYPLPYFTVGSVRASEVTADSFLLNPTLRVFMGKGPADGIVVDSFTLMTCQRARNKTTGKVEDDTATFNIAGYALTPEALSKIKLLNRGARVIFMNVFVIDNRTGRRMQLQNKVYTIK